ncbi:MAG: metallophosphoesterase, partial [Waterburya sp.]
LPYGGQRYFVGLNQVEDTVEYTNRGLGMTGLPLRFNSRPEITVFTLHTVS